jgi:hypothetical protein
MKRPVRVTIVGALGIIAGVSDCSGLLLSRPFAARFVPVFRAVPLNWNEMLSTLLAIALIDMALGLGVVLRSRLALFGMLARTLVAFYFDYLTLKWERRRGCDWYCSQPIRSLGVAHTESRAWFGGRDAAPCQRPNSKSVFAR